MEALSSSVISSSLHPNRTSLPFSKYSPIQVSLSPGRSSLQGKSQSSVKSREPSLPATILNKLECIINKFIDPPPVQSSFDPEFVLTGNFSPVHELPPTECQVIFGALPSCLDGAYMRIGPNPQFFPRGPYHLFDGDGMVHCLRVTSGGTCVTLSSRYIQTYKYSMERQAGGPIFPNLFSGFNSLSACLARGALVAARIATRQYDHKNGVGSANTSLAQIGGRLYALHEADLPYEIQVTPEGDILTITRQDFGDELSPRMTAHPKKDPETGEVFAFLYEPFSRLFATFFRFDKMGNKIANIPIFSMNRPTFLHDFAITQKYAIFPGTQLGMYPASKMLFGGGPPVGVDPELMPRIGVIPRNADNEKEMRWFDVPGINLVHVINAWDEVDQHGNESIALIAPNILSPEHTIQRMDLIHGSIEMIRIDLSNGMVSRTTLSATNLEFGVLNPNYIGRKNRYTYAAIGDPFPKISGVVKLDLEAEGKNESVVARRMYGVDCYGGESFFIAREPDNKEAEEDDGYLVCYIHNEMTGESSFIVMDAKSTNLDVVARVALPQRVPYGFHGLFVKEKDLIGYHEN